MGCGASAARREARAADVQRREQGDGASLLELEEEVDRLPGIDGLPTPEQRSQLGIRGGKQRTRITGVLRDMPLLAHVGDKDLAEIVRKKLPQPFLVAGGTEILSEGFVPDLDNKGPFDGLFVLLDGALQVVKTFPFGQQAVWDLRTDGGPAVAGVPTLEASTPFFGERVLCGLSGSRSATVRSVGPAEVLNIPRAVWTQVLTRAMGRVVEGQQMLQMLQEYALLLEGGHAELAAEFGETVQRFALDKELPAPDLADPSRGRTHRQRRGSVTKIVSRDELRAKRRASVGDVSPTATQHRKSEHVRTRRNSVTENLVSSKHKSTRYQSRAERRKSAASEDAAISGGDHRADHRRRKSVGEYSPSATRHRRRKSSSATDHHRSSRRKSVTEGLIEREHNKRGHGHRRRRKSVDKEKESSGEAAVEVGEDAAVALPGQPLHDQSPEEAGDDDDDKTEDGDTKHALVR